MSHDEVIENMKECFRRPESLHSLETLPQRKDVSSSVVSSGWPELDEIWKVYPGQFTIVTGIPGHGKSTLVFNIIIQLSRVASIRSFLYAPENEPYLRSNFKRLWGNHSGFDEFCAKECFVQSSMPEYYDSAPQDLPWVLDQAVYAIRKEEVGLVVIDPWNELEHCKPNNMMMTDYIRECLMHLKQFCRAYSVAVILVAHPTKAVTEDGGRTPRLSDIEGSMSWYNKCDNGLIVQRDIGKNSCRVMSAKVRERGAGKIGEALFDVDPASGIFTPQYGAVSL